MYSITFMKQYKVIKVKDIIEKEQVSNWLNRIVQFYSAQSKKISDKL